LRDVRRADPRAPVASFDCARAVTPDEKAICADVTLARLDRAVAETWSSQLRNENDPPRKTALKTQQVAWLNLRGTRCHGEQAARIACLTALYSARLAALEAAE